MFKIARILRKLVVKYYPNPKFTNNNLFVNAGIFRLFYFSFRAKMILTFATTTNVVNECTVLVILAGPFGFFHIRKLLVLVIFTLFFRKFSIANCLKENIYLVMIEKMVIYFCVTYHNLERSKLACLLGLNVPE